MKKNDTDKGLQQASSEQTLLATPVMNIVSRKMHCERTGVENDFYKLKFPHWVNVIACTESGKILLVRQYRFGTDRFELEIPGGTVNDGESPLAAGLRELLEETGYRGTNGRIIGKVCPNPALQDNFCYTVLVENVEKVAEPDLDDMEEIEVLAIFENEISSLIEDGSINHGLVLNGLMFFRMEK